LPDQPAVALGLLVSRAGELVTREEMRAALWPHGTFVDFENGINVTINRVRDALGDSASSPRFIETVPRRGHRFIAPVTRVVAASAPPATLPEPGAPPAAPTPRPSVRRRNVAAAAGVMLAGALLAIVATRRPLPKAEAGMVTAAPRLTRLTSFPGIEACPALSPDGQQVAFAWTPGAGGLPHIYVTIVGTTEKRELTTGDGVDSHPAWSPDGRFVAYLRFVTEGPRLYVVSAVGRASRRISDFAPAGRFAWSPDGDYLLSGRSDGAEKGIWAVPISGGNPRLVVKAPRGGGAAAVALSPDSGRMAYASCRTVSDAGYFDCDADIVGLDASLTAVGPPVTVASMSSLGGFTWTRDGRVLVFFCDAEGTGQARLCRADVETRKVDTIDAAGINVGLATTSRANDRLVYVRFDSDADIAAAQVGRGPVPVAASSADEGMPSYAPDGRRIAFTSARTGPTEIWVAEASGANPRQLTHGPGPVQIAPRWSPDGRGIAFMSQAADGHRHVWTIGSDGGPIRQLTAGTGDELVPTWSADGRFIYFGASQGHGFDIWRVAVDGGAQERVTTNGSGFVAFEQPGGGGLLYQKAAAASALLLTPAAGGPPRQIVSCAEVGEFNWNRTGIYYVPCGQGPGATVRRIPRLGERDVPAFTLEGLDYPNQASMTVSPDGRTVLYVRSANDARGGDLWMIEPFK
jgi:Tol biopolymer transport system component/DNA-binding winged helix-turn-helix (wHTH) protein